MIFYSFLAIGMGAAMGAWLRWGIGVLLNPILATLPMGTLTVNLVGGYLIGISLTYFISHPNLSEVWRLFIITGFLGGLTTFSTFSAEVVMLFDAERYGWAFITAATHLIGSLILTGLGIYTVKWLQN